MSPEFLSAVVLLILVLDPVGNLPLVSSLLSKVDPARRRKVVLRECAIAYLILLLFMFGGQRLLDLMHLSEISLSIAGGVILFMIAIRMVFGTAEGAFGDSLDKEPFIVPLAIPFIAGPSALATVMLMVSRDPAKTMTWVAALTVVMIATTVILALADRIEKLVGKRGVQALERLMGLILTAIAVEMLLGGIQKFVQQLK
ncbi:MAG: NAAT family transporter [Betaproteobacteria bacterium]|nr:NAAT family transporter [Betaproteobacteria bacterium]